MFTRRLLSGFSSLLIVTFLLFGHQSMAADAANGEKLFKANCGSCHIMGRPMTGPNLEGVVNRWEDKDLLYTWIKNPGKAKATGDPYVMELLAQWESKSGLMAAQAVSDAEIDDILAYVMGWTPPPPPATSSTPGPEGEGISMSDSILILCAISIALFLILGLVLTIRKRIGGLIDEKEGKAEDAKPSPIAELIAELKDFVTNQMNPTLLVMTVGGIVTLPVLLVMYSNGQDLGAQIGYAPEQPIKFSHKLHAGQYGIDCQYCHTGVEKSKNANIPSANICMNCHYAVNQGPKYGTTEIAKIYAAIGFDPATTEYSGETKPIEWVRIHNLPDHVYFSHKQHVVAGNLDCENCHGKVQEMEKVQQVSLLEMGWCIDCHRETEVVIENNYYQEHFHQVFKDDYSKFIEENPDKKDEVKIGDFIKDHKKYTIGDLGGLECQKCHY